VSRARVGHLVALVAAAALLLFMAMDWYSTKAGEEARRVEETAQKGADGTRAGEVRQEVAEQSRLFAEGQERNAWQAGGAIDRLILVVLLASAAFTFAAVLLGAAGREDLTGLAGGIAVGVTMLGAVLLVYRLLQEPGVDALNTVEIGAPLAILALGVMVLGIGLSTASAAVVDE
jgi:hypothetical protein